jgi:hypothetical protein
MEKHSSLIQRSISDDWSSGLTHNLKTQLKRFAREKHSSLIQRSISDEEEKVLQEIDQMMPSGLGTLSESNLLQLFGAL